MRILSAGVSLVALLAASSAMAEGFFDEPYFKLEGGIVLEDDEVEVTGTPTFDASHERGWTGAAGFGWYLADNFRFEIEAAYQAQEFDSGPFTPNDDGNVEALTVMPMIFADMDLGGRLTPFIGAGLGLAAIQPNAAFTFPTTNESTTNLAWQLTGGVSAAVSDAIDLTVRYRYLEAGEYDMGPVEADYANHAILGGLRFRLGGAPVYVPEPEPEPEPEPDMCESMEEVVYFDFDRSEIRADAEPVLDRAADFIAECEADNVVIEGHTDTSGSSRYNQGLSERRAEAVRGSLVLRGVPSEIISTEAYGETRPAVDTGDGVREQANRRSVVVIRIN